ncbi:MAG: cupin domain-containing protein [Rhodospirillales bacterium]|nr:cupin domain-containing protein [Rhodospirillales bacterium]
MTASKNSGYVIDDRQWIANTPDVRVQILTLGKGQEVPWHYHTDVTDTFFCLDGPMVVNTKDDNEAHELQVGDTYAVPPKTAHQVTGKNWGPCRFLIVQGVGEYDFVPVEA